MTKTLVEKVRELMDELAVGHPESIVDPYAAGFVAGKQAAAHKIDALLSQAREEPGLREAFEAGYDLCLRQAAADDWSTDCKTEAARLYPLSSSPPAKPPCGLNQSCDTCEEPEMQAQARLAIKGIISPIASTYEADDKPAEPCHVCHGKKYLTIGNGGFVPASGRGPCHHCNSTTVEFYAIQKDFSTFGESWRFGRPKMRNPLDKCGWCKKPFKDGDMIALGFRRTAKNMVLCQTCAEKAIGPVVEELTESKR